MYTVAVIDDEPWTRDVIKAVAEWERLNLEMVGEASDGESGWELIDKIRPDIVITDVRMPGINGLELIRRMRERHILSPAIIISGYDDYEYVHTALKLEVVDYLLKPIKPDDLNKELEGCVRILEEKTVSENQMFRAELMSEVLEQKCRIILNDIRLQLSLWRKEELGRSFQLLEKAIQQERGGAISFSEQIGIFYEVTAILQKYFEQTGISRKNLMEDTEYYVFNRENKLHDMVGYLLMLFLKGVDIAESFAKKKHRFDTDRVIRFLKEKYADGITLEETADYFHVSKEYLSKVFKNDQKIGFSEYILHLRMQRAAELIREYDAPLKEVGYLVGYVDQAHFYKTFKKYYHITPGEMRAG